VDQQADFIRQMPVQEDISKGFTYVSQNGPDKVVFLQR
jgi:hypothetical protein